TETQVLLLGVGTPAGGPLRNRDGSMATDTSGRPLQGRFDGESLKRLSNAADIPLASVTLDDSDVEWVQRRAEHHLQVVQAQNTELRWKEFGYWLTFPIALLGAVWFRRGWVVRWVPMVALAILFAHPNSGQAAQLRLIDLFLTPDQQGRWYFDRADYKTAGERFQDPMWKGVALYRAGDYRSALEAFAARDTADAFFLMGNCYARLKQYPAALQAYDNALKERPGFPEAQANRKLVAALIPKQAKDDEEAADPDLKPDQIKFDEEGKKGKFGQVMALKKT